MTPVPSNTLRSTRLGYIVAADNFRTTSATNQIAVWHVSGSASDPALTPDGNLNVPVYEVPPDIPQPDTNFVLDSLDTRLWQAVTAVDPNDGRLTVWTQRTIRGPEARAAIRWYELQPPRAAGDPRTPRQTGMVESAQHHVFNGAISAAANGNDAAINYNVASQTLHPRIRARSRLGTMTPGTMAPEVTLRGSAISYQDATCSDTREGPERRICRWGDYAAASPDPRNAALIWGSNQYARPLSGENTMLQDGTVGPYPHWGTRNFALRPPSSP